MSAKSTSTKLKSATTEVNVASATAPSNGQVLTATSSTTATWQTPSSGSTSKMTIATAFETSARFSPNTSGTASVTYTTSGLVCSCTSSGYAYVNMLLGASTSFRAFSGSPTLTGSCYWRYVKTGNEEATMAFLGIADFSTGKTSEAFTDAHVGFMITTTAGGVKSLYATNANGTTQTKSASLDTPADADFYDFRIDMTAATNIAFYWRKNGGSWSSATNHTTNIPAESTTIQGLAIGQIRGGAITTGSSSWGGVSYSR